MLTCGEELHGFIEIESDDLGINLCFIISFVCSFIHKTFVDYLFYSGVGIITMISGSFHILSTVKAFFTFYPPFNSVRAVGIIYSNYLRDY